MTANIEYRVALKEDIVRLGKLYENVFHRSIDIVELEWRFTQNPVLREIYYNYVAVNSEGNIVGHTAFIPMDYVYKSNTLKGALSVGSAALKEYAGIFPKLHIELEEKLVVDKFDFLFAFPNEDSFPFFVKYFKYQQHFFNYLQLEVSEIVKFSENVLLAHTEYISNQLMKDFLQWRVYTCPINTYEIFENPNINIIYKRYAHSEVDLLCFCSKKKYLKLKYFSDFLSRIEGARKINIYSTNQLFSQVLKKIGFKEMPVRNKCVYKILNPFLKKNEFFFQMIDSDVF